LCCIGGSKTTTAPQMIQPGEGPQKGGGEIAAAVIGAVVLLCFLATAVGSFRHCFSHGEKNVPLGTVPHQVAVVYGEGLSPESNFSPFHSSTKRRMENIENLFNQLDPQGTGFISQGYLKKLAEQRGFPGSDQDWKMEFDAICQENGCNRVNGIDFNSFDTLVSDPKNQSFYCSDSDLMVLQQHSALQDPSSPASRRSGGSPKSPRSGGGSRPSSPQSRLGGSPFNVSPGTPTKRLDLSSPRSPRSPRSNGGTWVSKANLML